MKKLFLLIVLFVFTGGYTLLAQTLVITGKVASSIEGEGPIPGVTVVVKGTTIGTITDANGKYSITVPANATTLVFSYIGMKSQEVAIAGRTVIDGTLQSDLIGLQEVVVTSGYGIKRAPRSSSALNQVVSSDKLTAVRQTNVNNALAGKVSGIQFQGQSAAALGRQSAIRLRGDGGFSTGTSILYVVDGTILPNSNDINMDDIEDISVLSGPSASAILGSQGANGAIIITTKKAKMSGTKSMGVEVNSGFLSSSVYVLPNYQNDYAGGNVENMYKYTYKSTDPVEWQSLDGKYYPDYTDDASWGPRMAGQEYIPWYSWYAGTKYTGTTAKLVPQPSNARDFFDTGYTFNNSVAFSKVSEGFNIRAIVGNISVKGLIPETTLNKTTFAVKTTYDITKKLSFGANVNFFTTLTNGEFDDGYSNQSTGSFNQWFHRDLDMNILRELKDLRTPEGIWASWNHSNPTSYDPTNLKPFYAGNYWYNFYKWFDLVKIPSRADRLFGDISLNYKIIEGLSAKITYRRQENNTWGEQMYSTDLYDSGTQTFSNSPEAKGFYRTETTYSNRENVESLLSFTKTISDIKVNANAGTDFFSSVYKLNRAQTLDGFNIKNLYLISNSISQPIITNTRQLEKSRAAFVRADVGFKDYLFGEFTLRNDWYSVLPPDKNSILSKSFGGSFVFSDILKLSWLDFGKVRAAWGEIPTVIGIYDYPGFAYSVGANQWNSNFVMNTPDQLVDPNISGAVKTQKEIGFELRFMENKVGVTATYWDGSENEIPYAISIAQYSGFATKFLNTGKITKRGIDLSFNLKPVNNSNLTWDFNATFAYLMKMDVVSIAEGVDQFMVQGQWLLADGSARSGTPAMIHAKGRPWGELYGAGISKDSVSGLPILTSEGFYTSNPKTYFGNVLPKVTGGIQNTFKIMKNFTVIMNFDYQFGGKFFSLSDMWGTYSGLTAKTSGLNDKGNPNRDAVDNGGGIHVFGVTDMQDYVAHPKGDPIYEKADYYVDAQAYWHSTYDNQFFDFFIHDLTFIKMRELSIGYEVPVDKIGLSKYVQGITVSLFAQNPLLIYAKDRDFDPSEISRAGGETGQFPGVRSFGTNIKINF
ncbi:MAG: SusC/RagA family TonB-linked outer membrane protein [Bacteroidia bacterium]|nr:SusC/RagA family TonB-linked outer membrane protein [Bacteroidia bacterium]